jgi:TonB family protein
MGDLESPDQVTSAEFNLRSGLFSLTLRFEPDALAMLGREISVGYVTVPKRAAEAGGIFSGEIVQNNSNWTVTIQDLIPVPIQYEYGPTYRLSTADKEIFGYLAPDQELGGHRIGWYRSNTRPRREPDEDDREISREFFQSDQNIFLFCDVSPDSRIHATCIIIQPNRVEMAFPFELGRVTGPENLRNSWCEEAAESVVDDAGLFEALMPSPSPAPRVESIALPSQFAGPDHVRSSWCEEAAEPVVHDAGLFEALMPSPPPTPRVESIALPSQGRAPRRYVSGANLRFAATVIAASAIAYYARGRIAVPVLAPAFARAPSESPVTVVQAAESNPADSLGLRAEYQGNSLLLGWDRRSARVNAATSGVFIIGDGSKTRVLTLSPRELRNGGILYKPAADDINVEFQVIEPRGRTASESIRIIGAPAPVSAAAPIGQIARRVLPQPPVPRREKREMLLAPVEAPPPSSARTKQRMITTVDAPLINPEATMRPPWFAPALMPLPPQPAAQLDRALTNADADMDTAVPAAPGFHPATAIHAPQPRVPQGVYLPQYVYDRPFLVKVEVSINAAGSVTDARLVDTIGPYASQLGPSALNTARAWTFHPATLGGQPVASTMVVTFHYSRPL